MTLIAAVMLRRPCYGVVGWFSAASSHRHAAPNPTSNCPPQKALEGKFNWTQGMMPEASFLRLQAGSDSSARRNQMVDWFNKRPSQKVFLISVQAGGVGINLTSASRVIIYDAPWNPSHNEQAVARAYRLGHTKEVHVYRFVTDKWMESQMNTRAVTKTLAGERIGRGADGDEADGGDQHAGDTGRIRGPPGRGDRRLR